MGQMKSYLLTLLQHCSEHDFGQRAVEWGILHSRVKLAYHLDTDLRAIMGEPGHPKTGLYDSLCTDYRQACEANRQRLLTSYQPLLTAAGLDLK